MEDLVSSQSVPASATELAPSKSESVPEHGVALPFLSVSRPHPTSAAQTGNAINSNPAICKQTFRTAPQQNTCWLRVSRITSALKGLFAFERYHLGNESIPAV